MRFLCFNASCVCHILTAVVSNKVVIWHWEHSSNPILDAVFVIDSIVSTEHSISKAREIFETLLFAISLDFGHFVRLRFRHAIEVFRCHKSHAWNAWKDCKFCEV
jgi:mitochondrial fission protein ELM1